MFHPFIITELRFLIIYDSSKLFNGTVPTGLAEEALCCSVLRIPRDELPLAKGINGY
jgi:hypothetical protein